MKVNRKEDLQVYSALAMLASGSLMAFTSMWLPPLGEVNNGALWYTGQCFLYAGGIFGIGTWARSKGEELDRKIEKRLGRDVDEL